MKRSSRLRSDPAKARAWRDRSRERAIERAREALSETRRCRQCGDEIQGRGEKFCGHACAAKFHNADRKRPLSAHCTVCGTSIDPGNPSKPRKTCGRPECRNEAIARAKRGASNPNWLPITAAQRWHLQKERSCRRCGRRRRLQLHHVVYAQHVRRERGDTYDPRDSLTLCLECHVSYHKGGPLRLPLNLLRDENFEFARELFGPGAAYEYLRRRYGGADPRLDALLAETTA